jgi:hypothetical protein
LESPSFWQNLMQYRCSTYSVIWVKCNAMSTYYSTSHTGCLGEKDAPGEAAKNHACAWRSPTRHCDQTCQPAISGFPEKK